MAFMTIAASNSMAQDIETLVMPGQVIADHAEFEPECSSCHTMFDKAAQRQLCMDCHEDIAADISASSGFHGQHPDANSDQCFSCHTEHEGRDAIVIILDEATFDHDQTDFELGGSHAEAECIDCHEAGEKHRDAPSDCAACHIDDSPHEQTMGDECGSCHAPSEWQDADFDHDQTDYPLLGKHAEAACLDCHADHTFLNAPTECVDCHAEDDAHNGRSGNACGNCHNPSDWLDTSFNHARDTDFELLGKHAEQSCGDCHSENPFEDVMDTACASCHLEDDAHDAHRGDQCDTCHTSTAWPEAFFDHDVDTDYVLRGGHIGVECNDCHIEPIFDVALQTACSDCHLDDDPHEQTLGTQCESCHSELSWQDAVFFDHDFTMFPLLGRHQENECEDCHATHVFGDTDDNCGSCHEDDDPHEGNFPTACDSCHNPTAWEAWLFDHDMQTEFRIDGAHLNVSCADCHRVPLDKITSVDGSCGSCHRANDIHDGEFGFDCGRCHSSESFKDVRSLQ